jgi:hypothetical protein
VQLIRNLNKVIQVIVEHFDSSALGQAIVMLARASFYQLLQD